MNIDLNDIRAVITVASFALFIAIVLWSYSSRRKPAFERAARSVLDEGEEQ